MAKKEQNQPLAQPGDLKALLLQYRDMAGYTTEQMASALCLSEDVIKNLENEEFHLLAEPPYVRGYIRNYTKLVDIDDKEVIHCYETLRGADPDELDYHIKVAPSMYQSKSKLSPILTQLVFLLLLLGAIAGLFMIPAVNQWISSTWDSFSKQTGAENKPSLLGTMPVPLPLNTNKSTPPLNQAISTKNTQTPISSEPAKQTPQKIKDDTVKQLNKEMLEAENNKTLENKPKIAEDTTNTETSNTINIKMIFTKEVWMRIRDKNKKTVYEGQTAAGKEKTLNLEKPLIFRVGNAQGLSLFVNDKAVDISQYIKGSVANFTLK